MTVIDRITTGLGMGLFYGLKVEGLHKSLNNMTLGVHAQEWEAQCDYGGHDCKLNEVYIGVLFFRFIFQFVQPND